MKHSAARRRIPVLSTIVTVGAAIVYGAWEVLDDLADWLARSRAVHTAAKAIGLMAVVVALALLSACDPKDTRPGPIENTALEAQP